MPRILLQDVAAGVARHLDEADHVDEQARLGTRHQRDVEDVDVGRDLGQERLQRILQKLEPAETRRAQLGTRSGALRIVGARAPHRQLQRVDGGRRMIRRRRRLVRREGRNVLSHAERPFRNPGHGSLRQHARGITRFEG